ncbi:major facilitator superfamily MFS_1 [Cellulomonas flavigena DSM 20109]|uniref:Major facilitator superfamily MFS_1 n=1 Tax=Cellulomonas flavigena (strain ATCC 482 / DSM 20109 / BCRC 11376 / JCM 18109 / NBRC 3775 / NCIMB 8073 / NRS 134) TaxID=446466 RepID=D5UJ10_CELFN|nr:MFS transporter [Cellulomonas flavigena]ADG75576.1 major facilitator superfamily MFS_1 [Cellulomonas flavigena DSM 20109]
MPRPAPAVARARLLLLGLFALAGVAFASWLARIPTVRDLLDLSTADLGVLLLVGSVGSLLTVTAAGAAVQRVGSRRVLLVSTLVLAAALVLLGVGPTVGSRALLAAGIFLNGVAVALGNVAINVESARVERAMGRTVIPQFHAAFSIGAVLGSGTGALASATGVPVGVQLPLTAAVVVVWRLASLPGVVLPPSVAEAARASLVSPTGAAPVRGVRRLGTALDAWREPRTLLVGVVVLAAAFSEGAANNWLSLAVVDGFARSESVGGAVLGLFVASMTVVRLVGIRLVDRFGRVTVLRASGSSSVVGLLVFGFAPSLPLACVGVVLWGVGAALAVPVGIAAASDDPARAAGRVAVVSAFASVASLVAPPVLGLAAQSVGARHALVLIVAAMVASVLVAPAVARERTDDDAPAPPAAPDGPPTRDGSDADRLVRLVHARHHGLPRRATRRRGRTRSARPAARGGAR